MIVNAKIICPWCGVQVAIPEKSTTRAFMIIFNRLRREHDHGCEFNGKVKKKIKDDLEKAEQVAINAILKASLNDK